MKTLEIHFGALADDLEVQLKRQGFKANEELLLKWEELRYCINYAWLNDCLTDAAKDRALKSLYGKIKMGIVVNE